MDSVDYFLLKEQEVLSCSLKKNNINIYKKKSETKINDSLFSEYRSILKNRYGNWLRKKQSHIGFGKTDVLFYKDVLKMYSKFRWSPVSLLYIFRTPFPKNTYGGLLLEKIDLIGQCIFQQQWENNMQLAEAATGGVL